MCTSFNFHDELRTNFLNVKRIYLVSCRWLNNACPFVCLFAFHRPRICLYVSVCRFWSVCLSVNSDCWQVSVSIFFFLSFLYSLYLSICLYNSRFPSPRSPPLSVSVYQSPIPSPPSPFLSVCQSPYIIHRHLPPTLSSICLSIYLYHSPFRKFPLLSPICQSISSSFPYHLSVCLSVCIIHLYLLPLHPQSICPSACHYFLSPLLPFSVYLSISFTCIPFPSSLVCLSTCLYHSPVPSPHLPSMYLSVCHSPFSFLPVSSFYLSLSLHPNIHLSLSLPGDGESRGSVAGGVDAGGDGAGGAAE